jgi:hypothetical protein
MKQKLLEHYILEAMAKSKAEHRKVSAIVADAMPEVIQELRRMATATDSDLSTKKFAIGMLESFFRTLLITSQSENRIAVKRKQTQVRAKKVKVEETKAAIKVHQVRAETDKKLAALGGS